ncbi:response regulator [Rufibacter roseus]|uniref:Response regulator n=1 Tax=Rufibacter roseus TaxID=1567108 RepID=A0ABW2DUC0_9BACT|nr:response regulator [Rufibacter roseus]
MAATKRILLVDDDSTYLFIMRRKIKKLLGEAEIVAAANGAEAMRLLQMDMLSNNLPHIIITDVEMPVMDGLTFARMLAGQGMVDFTKTKVVLNSNKTTYNVMVKDLENFGVTFLAKPLTEPCLIRILECEPT